VSYRVIVRPEAQLELGQAFDWYESQSDGLGLEFLLATQAAQESLKRNPELYQKSYRDIRKALIQRFPFAIFYTCSKEIIFVLAVYHASRNPAALKDKLKSRRKDSKTET